MLFDNCQECHQSRSAYDWCKPCNSKHFQSDFGNWTSGNKNIDQLIQRIQLNSSSSQEIIEWIPENRLKIQEHVGKGRFGTVYKAIWKDGCISYWNYKEKCWERCEENCVVAVKVLNKSKRIKLDLLNQIFSAQKYNVTGKLQAHSLWLEKLEILMDISSTLMQLHNEGLLHENLHTNNILRSADYKTYLSDLGLTYPPNKLNPKIITKILGCSNNYGLLNFLPPEIINGKPYTKESDIYCLGLIFWEISLQKPFHNLIMKEKPPFKIEKPELFTNARLPYPLELLISECWDHNPSNRPTIKYIHKKLNEWWMSSWNNSMDNILNPFINPNRPRFNSAKKFDPIYIYGVLKIPNNDKVHFMSEQCDRFNFKYQEIVSKSMVNLILQYIAV
ncbi:9621_t:CDS:2 [Funneliformis mosseae]|uniref:9621_t:CDS:1 n=1 Tax=Funneliformis mosseae TaxID=27381 RepID=A0A9N9F6M9_FUNMO|nr:9621_t:CDS:2 [Funneliformis mosseae]